MKPADVLATLKIVGILGVAGVAIFAGYKLYRGVVVAGGAVGDVFGSIGDAVGGAVDWVAAAPGRAAEAASVALAGGGDPDYYTDRFDPASPASQELARQWAEWEALGLGNVDPYTGQIIGP